MNFADKDISEFTKVLASKSPVPGGGGASALVGAIGISLSNMVGNLTIGKPKYAQIEDEAKYLVEEGENIRLELLELIDEDACAFEPLSRAYGIPKDDPSRDTILEEALRVACAVPIDMMWTLGRAIELHARMGQIGTAIALSDVGVGAVFCKTAMRGAALNVFVNTQLMKDREYAAKLERAASSLLDTYCPMADKVYESVMHKIKE